MELYKSNSIVNATTSTEKYQISTFHNQIHFNGDITAESMSKLIEEIHTMQETITEKYNSLNRKISANSETDNYVTYTLTMSPILLYITSNGGSVYQALRVCDIIRKLKVPVHTICTGLVASAATLISISGKKRFITPYTYMLIHQIRSGMWGKYTEINDEYINLTNLMTDIKKIYQKNSKLTDEKLSEVFKSELIWNAETCVANGVVDEILE